MQIKTIVMSTLLTTAARWISRQNQACAWGPTASAFSPSPMVDRTRVRSGFSSSTSSAKAKAKQGEEASTGTSKDKTGTTALVFDTETTGMVRFRNSFTDPSQPDLVQLGFLMVDTGNWKIRNQGSFLVQLRNTTVGIEEGAQRVHGISEEDCSLFGIKHGTALDLFENLCSKADVIVGHNIRFDTTVMQTAFHRGRSGSDSFSDLLSSKQKICTMIESIDLCQLPSKYSGNSSSSGGSSNPVTYKWPSLEEAYGFVTGGDQGDGETLVGAHDALVDSQACLKVFRYLVEHGHVSVGKDPKESPDTTTIAKKTTTVTSTVPETERPTVLSDDSTSTASPATEPSASVLFLDIEATEGEYNDNPPERNGGIDRSREVEEAAASDYNTAEHSGSVDTSNNIEEAAEGPPRSFDPASFSLDMLEKDASNNSSSSSANASTNTTGGGFRVRGNTYKHKELIKQLGGRWNGQSKEWVFRETQHLSELESYDDLTIVPFSEE